MVGLAEDGSVYADKGFTVERMSDGMRHLAQQHHMPMDTSLRPRLAGTVPACRAVVAVRRHRPELEAGDASRPARAALLRPAPGRAGHAGRRR